MKLKGRSMKVLFVLSPCNFTHIGFNELIHVGKVNDLRIVNCTDYRDVMKYVIKKKENHYHQ